MDSVPPHPAITAAQAVLAKLDPGLRPVAMVEREDSAVAILLESRDFRVIVIVERRAGEWVAPAMITGTPRRNGGARPLRTTEDRPLLRMSRKRVTHLNAQGKPRPTSWFALLGTAAADATTMTLTSTIDTHAAPISPTGVAFALVRVPSGEQPRVQLHTNLGRTVTVEL